MWFGPSWAPCSGRGTRACNRAASSSVTSVAVAGCGNGAAFRNGVGRDAWTDDGRTASASCARGFEDDEAPAEAAVAPPVGAQSDVVARSRSDIVMEDGKMR